ncbi:MAG: hypothetical protein E7367_04130 [Clostridiales bacterium]|nr:hypothetical protein [Clostridiales bacterium]
MNVLILHGSYGKPFENWFPWLESELSKRNTPCLIPTFPTPEHQNYTAWKNLLDYYFNKGFINEETVVIGHSCGAAFAVKYILEKAVNIKALITVAGYNHFYSGDHMDQLNGSFYFNKDCGVNLKKWIPTRIAFYSSSDPFIPIEKLEEFSSIIQATPKAIPDAGHFNASAGYTTFHVLLEILNQL